MQWRCWFSYAILQTLSSFVYAGKGKAPAAPGSVFDNFLLLYVHMLLVALAYMLASYDRCFKISSYWLYIFCTSFSSV